MIDLVSKLVHDLEESIQVDPAEDRIECTEEAYFICKKTLSSLRNMMLGYSFASIKEQVCYFKELKPRLICCLAFLEKRYSYVVFMHQSSSEIMKRRYWETELSTVERFLAENARSYSYYNGADRPLNIRYFTTQKNKAADFSLTTYHQRTKYDDENYDFFLGAYLANQRLKQYLVARINKIEANQISVKEA